MTKRTHAPSAAALSNRRRRPSTRAVRLFADPVGQDRARPEGRLFVGRPFEPAVDLVDARRAELRRLESAVRAERARGAARHPAYDVARHARLARELTLAHRDLRAAERRASFEARAFSARASG